MRLASGGTRLGHPSVREAKRTSDRSTHAEAAHYLGGGYRRKPPKASLHACALPRTTQTPQQRTRARSRERSCHPACRYSPSAWRRARTRRVCAAPERGDSAAERGGGGEERGGCVPWRGADSALWRHEHARGGALTIQEETPSIAMERCEIARICLARTT